MGLMEDDNTPPSALAAPTDVVRVRFKNVPNGGGKDVVILTQPGKNVMALGDENGVKVPRACRTGLCGTCTADLVDPNWDGADNGTPGVQTVRCCSTSVMVPQGMDEMVIDLHRNSQDNGTPKSNPMARFDDGWENSYVADYMKTDRDAAGGDPNGTMTQTEKNKNRNEDPNVRSPSRRPLAPRKDVGGNMGGVAPWDHIW